jgi:hypothetical protein
MKILPPQEKGVMEKWGFSKERTALAQEQVWMVPEEQEGW